MKNKLSAIGTFDVKLKPQDEETVETVKFQKMLINKVFHGELEGTSTVEMLAATSEKDNSGGYVALERVTGVLKGKKGSFVLLQIGFRENTSQQLKVSVVPGCSTGGLIGLEGEMTITIKDPIHHYTFDYDFK